MATATIEITLFGWGGFTVDLDLFELGVADTAATTIETTETNNRPGTYLGATDLGLTGQYLVYARERGTTRILGGGYVRLTDTETTHIVTVSPDITSQLTAITEAANAAATAAAAAQTAAEEAAAAVAAADLPGLQNTLQGILDVAEFARDLSLADRYIDTAASPFRLVLIKQGSGELADGERLLEQDLYDRFGNGIARIDTFIAESRSP